MITRVDRVPTELDEKVATLHFPALGEVLTELFCPVETVVVGSPTLEESNLDKTEGRRPKDRSADKRVLTQISRAGNPKRQRPNCHTKAVDHAAVETRPEAGDGHPSCGGTAGYLSSGTVNWSVVTLHRAMVDEQKGGDPKTDQVTQWADSELPGWHPEETASSLPLVNEKRYSRTSVGGINAKGRGPKTPVRETEGPKDPGVAAPLAAAGCRGNRWYDMGGRSHASASSSPSSHFWTSPWRTFPSGPSTARGAPAIPPSPRTFVQWHQIL